MLSKKAIQAVIDSKQCRNRLAYEMNVNPRTVDRWLRRDDMMLTTVKALNIIKAETGLKDSEILEPVTA